jgi:cupin 2 domain-containing protein
MSDTKNLFEPIKQDEAEFTETLAGKGTTRIERIVSHGHHSPEGFWYDQDQDEWVTLLSGGARLRFERDEASIVLRPGDHLHIPAHVRHRVEWTDPDTDTVWLAVFYDAG